MACSRQYTAAHSSGSRPIADVRLLVIHSTEGPTAAGAAAWFANPASAGSAHVVVDDTSCYRTLPDSVTPWAAPGANEIGLHVEMAGYAKWGALWRLKHLRTMASAARVVAMWCDEYGIPATWLHPADLIGNPHARGVTTHLNVTRWQNAIHQPGDHTDPGALFPAHLFMTMVRRSLKQRQAAKKP